MNVRLTSYGGCWLLSKLKDLSIQRWLLFFKEGVFFKYYKWMDCCKMFVGQATNQLEFLVGKNQTHFFFFHYLLVHC